MAAKINPKLRILIKRYKDKQDLFDRTLSIYRTLRRGITLLQSDEFLMNINQETKELHLKNLSSEIYGELNQVFAKLEDEYKKYVEDLDQTGKLFKNKGFIEEICKFFTEKDIENMYLEEESVNRTVRVVREEMLLFKNIFKEIKTRYKLKEKEETEEKEKEVKPIEKQDLDLHWS